MANVTTGAGWQGATGSILVKAPGNNTADLLALNTGLLRWSGSAWEYIAYGTTAGTVAQGNHNHDAAYAALSHTHAISAITGLQTALDGKAAASHAHAISDVTGLQTALDGKSATSHNHAGVYDPAGTASGAVSSHDGNSGAHGGAITKANSAVQPGDLASASVSYAATAGSAPANGGNADTLDGQHAAAFATAAQGTKADAAAPQASTYTKTETDNLLDAKANATNVYDKSTSDGRYAPLSHSQGMGTITGLADALAAKADDGDCYLKAETYSQAEADAAFAAAAHGHSIAQVTNLQTTLDGKAAMVSTPTGTHVLKANALTGQPEETTIDLDKLLLKDGSVAATQPISGVAGVAEQHFVIKSQLDALAGGVVIKSPVLSSLAAQPPHVEGERYRATATAGDWTAGRLYTSTGGVWVDDGAPEAGWLVYDIAAVKWYSYNGAAWNVFNGFQTIGAGQGMEQNGTNFDVHVDGTSIDINGDNELEIVPDGHSQSMSTITGLEDALEAAPFYPVYDIVTASKTVALSTQQVLVKPGNTTPIVLTLPSAGLVDPVAGHCWEIRIKYKETGFDAPVTVVSQSGEHIEGSDSLVVFPGESFLLIGIDGEYAVV